MALVQKFKEDENEKKAWEMWLVAYSKMDKKNFTPFEKFYQPKKTVKKRSRQEIIDQAARFKGRANQ